MQQIQVFLSLILLGLFVTAIIAPIVIRFLYIFSIKVSYKLMKDKSNEEFIKIHGHKVSTPTLGGIMVAIGFLIVAIFFVPYSAQRDVLLFGWAIFFIYGLADGLLVYGRKLSDKMRKLEQSFGWRVFKLLLLYAITTIFIILIINFFQITSPIILFGLAIPLETITILLGSFAAVVAIYGMEITDGADGLVTGQFLVALVSYAFIAFVTQNVILLSLIGITIGCLLVYLYFNINPARVFMGGVGTFPVGFLLIASSLITNTLDVLLLMGVIFWVEVLTSTLQILSLKFRKKRLFRIAPIHHYFEAIGWPETKMVQRFWLFGSIFAIIALAYFVFFRGW
jgi:phospho-N-acetylmuramoyl-pentapeptide-transferase